MIRKGAGVGKGVRLLEQVAMPDLAEVPSNPRGLGFEIRFPSNKQLALCSISFEAVNHLLRISKCFYVVRT